MAADVGQIVIPAGTRGVLDILAAEYEALAAEQRKLVRAARLARRKGKAREHQLQLRAYERCAEMARVVLPGSVR